MNTNVQINVNVAGGCACPATPAAKGRSWLFPVAILMFGLPALALVTAFALGLLGTALGLWFACRIAELLLLIEEAVGGSQTRVAVVPQVMRALGPGVRVNEIDSTEVMTYGE